MIPFFNPFWAKRYHRRYHRLVDEGFFHAQKKELTWQPSGNGKNGRWRKKYRGRTVYLGSADSKSDWEAYNAALEVWKQKKAEIDAEEAAKPKLHQVDYEKAIADWERVLRWALDHGDDSWAGHARQRIADLRNRLDQKVPPPLKKADSFWDRFEWPQELLEDIAALIQWPTAPIPPSVDSPTIVRPSDKATYWLDGSPTRIEKAIWQDRIDAQDMEVEQKGETLGDYVARYLAGEQARVVAGGLSPGRFTSKRNNLLDFRDWLGPTTSLEAISGNRLIGFKTELLNRVAQAQLSKNTAHDRLNDALGFVRWLWRIEALLELPRILREKSRDLEIGKQLTKPRFFTIEEVKLCLTKATERTRLYLLLMLNCGMYQGDISNLKHDEVDFEAGTIERKRSKTSKHDSVPSVRYKLWSDTLALLKKHREPIGDRVLLNINGNPLVVRDIKPDGKPKTNDSVKNAYERLKKKTGIHKPLKLLRKTSANLIKSNEDYRGLEDLFLGLSPRRISEKHYTEPPELLLGKAITWLGEQYGIR